ncbi:hypothetical protein Ddye_016124 [Dipteronia dyeriana]|uniref:SWIM-type domain-containing protein n=1 Tax=Dipteronia dyeriana TaxID=168575 RepID=A0AAD9U659_9ROSI|nr:hypothetical protein Ddye_016124 [Dipteronia dyeriana]
MASVISIYVELRCKKKKEYWVVRMFVKDHTCNIDGFHARLRQANSWTVGELLAPKLQVHGHSLKPKDIMVEMQVEHGLHLLYSKAWRVKDHAEASVFGPPEESFKLLPAYCHRLEEVNPWTITALKTNVANQFEYMFIANATSLHGFSTVIRPVIAIDGTHLKGKFSGIMFVVICLDANNQDGNKDGLVNLYEKTCSCAKFEVDKLPCRHALAAIRYAKKLLPDYCGDCYKTTSWVEAYVGTIFPVGHPSDWNIHEDVRSKVILLPPFCAEAERPRKKRFKSIGEHGNGKTRNCTIYKKSGHNRQNCRNPQPCQAPPPCPSASSVTSAISKRPRRPYRCRKCGDEGHNS